MDYNQRITTLKSLISAKNTIQAMYGRSSHFGPLSLVQDYDIVMPAPSSPPEIRVWSFWRQCTRYSPSVRSMYSGVKIFLRHSWELQDPLMHLDLYLFTVQEEDTEVRQNPELSTMSYRVSAMALGFPHHMLMSWSSRWYPWLEGAELILHLFSSTSSQDLDYQWR